MKKVLVTVILAIVAITYFTSCKTKKETAPAPAPAVHASVPGYEAEIKNLLDNNCIPCHITKKGGIELSSYETTKAAGSKPRFLYAIYHAPGSTPMPPDREMLSQDILDKITAWVKGGMPK